MKNISCVTGKIKIRKACFGRTEAKQCPGRNDVYCVIDVTDKIKKFCEDKESSIVFKWVVKGRIGKKWVKIDGKIW